MSKNTTTTKRENEEGRQKDEKKKLGTAGASPAFSAVLAGFAATLGGASGAAGLPVAGAGGLLAAVVAGGFAAVAGAEGEPVAGGLEATAGGAAALPEAGFATGVADAGGGPAAGGLAEAGAAPLAETGIAAVGVEKTPRAFIASTRARASSMRFFRSSSDTLSPGFSEPFAAGLAAGAFGVAAALGGAPAPGLVVVAAGGLAGAAGFDATAAAVASLVGTGRGLVGGVIRSTQRQPQTTKPASYHPMGRKS